MKEKYPKAIFYTMFIIFIAIFALMFSQSFHDNMRLIFPFMAILALIFVILGIVLIIITVKSKLKGRLRKLLIWSGISAIAIPVCSILHNVVYGLFIYFFGPDFWGKGGDEPVFFILSIIVFPIVYLITSIWSIVLFRKKVKSNGKK